MKTEIRIVAAVIHQETGEVEVIVETTTDVGGINENYTLCSVWIDVEREM